MYKFKTKPKHKGFLGAVLGGVGGGLVSGLFNRSEANKNRDFQSYHAANAHQIEVADLKKAGLNPILSATGGKGASVPGGSQASMNMDTSGVVSNAIALQKNKKEQKVLDSQAEMNQANTIKAKAEADLTNAKAKKESIDALRKQREFGRIDEGVGSGPVAEVVESLPAVLRGPARAIAGATDSTYTVVKRELKDLISRFKQGPKASTARDVQSDQQLIDALKALDDLPESRYDKYKISKNKSGYTHISDEQHEKNRKHSPWRKYSW